MYFQGLVMYGEKGNLMYCLPIFAIMIWAYILIAVDEKG